MTAFSEKIKLSILTPTIPGREAKARKLAANVAKQIGDLPVEHLLLCDNRKRSIGAKRQALVDIARGEYIAFVDDDDDIRPAYVRCILQGIESGADVITFKQSSSYNGQKSVVVFGVNQPDMPYNPGGETVRGPWHVCAWRRAVVDGCQFGESNYGEDLVWCKQARNRIRTGTHIDQVLHCYTHDAATTAAPEN